MELRNIFNLARHRLYGTTSPPREGSDDDDRPTTFDRELQQAIQEVLARRRDEGAPRRSVTVEDVPDLEY